MICKKVLHIVTRKVIQIIEAFSQLFYIKFGEIQIKIFNTEFILVFYYLLGKIWFTHAICQVWAFPCNGLLSYPIYWTVVNLLAWWSFTDFFYWRKFRISCAYWWSPVGFVWLNAVCKLGFFSLQEISFSTVEQAFVHLTTRQLFNADCYRRNNAGHLLACYLGLFNYVVQLANIVHLFYWWTLALMSLSLSHSLYLSIYLFLSLFSNPAYSFWLHDIYVYQT